MRNLIRRAMTLLLSLAMIITYMPLSMITAYAATGDVPVHNKTLTPNGDGTYKLSLDVKGESEKKVTKTNVVVVLDTSGSMKETSGGQSRMQAAKNAVNSLATTLLSYNGRDGNPADTFELALVSFATTATARQKTTSLNTFTSSVNNLSADGGTNWEDALQEANNVSFGDTDNTYVIFVSDGNPTFRNTKGNYRYMDDYYYNTWGVYGNGSDSQTVDGISASTVIERCYDHAADDAKAIVDSGKVLYTIGAYGNVTRMESLNTYAGGSGYYAASNTAALEAALKEIVDEIQRAGFANVEVDDTTPANIQVGQTSAEVADLLEIEPNTYKYYRSGGTYGNKTEWTDIPDECKANDTDGHVNWDLSSLGVLEDGVTYTVEFNVYPSQYTYDLIADLQNGVKTYSELPQSVKDFLTESYGLRTNAEAKITYKDTRETNPQEKDADYVNPEPVPLVADDMRVQKEWVGTYKDEQTQPMEMTLLKDGETYGKTIHLDNNQNPPYTNSIKIAVGLLRVDKAAGTVQVLDPGSDYQLQEPTNLSYHWELEAETLHPMLINGVKTMLQEAENQSVIPAGKDYASVSGVEYYRIDGTVYEAISSNANLKATNTRRSNLNLTKVVTGNAAPEDAEFTYNVKLDNPGDEDIWFSISEDAEGEVLVKDEKYVSGATAEVKDGEKTGYYYTTDNSQFTVTLKAGWNLRFTNVLTGTTYTMTETSMPNGFSYSSASVTPASDSTVIVDNTKTVNGTVDTGNTTVQVTYTNQYNPTSITPKVTKKVTGYDATQAFAFSLEPTGDTVAAVTAGKVVMPETTTATTKADLKKDETQELTFGDITFNEAGTYTFSIKETTTTTAKGWTYDNTAKTVTVTVAADGSGKLTATAEGNNPIVENKYEAAPVTGKIPVQKNITPAGSAVQDITGKFTFTLTPVGNAPMPEGKTSLTVTSGKDGAIVFFDEITYNKAETYEYNVVESFTNGEVGGVTLETTNPKKVTVVVSDDGSGALSTNIKSDEPLTFNNPYKTSAIDITIPAEKKLDKPEYLPGPDATSGTFTFTLEAGSNTAGAGVVTPMPKTTTATTGATGGQIVFGSENDPISFSVPGTYTYRIKETGNVPGVTNDTEATKTITVVVTDKGDGTLNASINDGKDIVFTNTYDAKPTSATIPVKKVLKGEGAPSIANEFTFTLKDEDGNTVDTKKNPSASGGQTSFDTLTFDKPGTYTYTVEESGKVAGVTNDRTVKTVTISVVDNKKGALEATCSATDANPVTFTNFYKEAEIEISVDKSLVGAQTDLSLPDITGKYTYTLKAGSNDAGVVTPMPAGGAVKTNPEANGGQVSFGTIKYTEPGTYHYTVTESGEVDGVTNGTPLTRNITVVVTKELIEEEVTETVTEEVPVEPSEDKAEAEPAEEKNEEAAPAETEDESEEAAPAEAEGESEEAAPAEAEGEKKEASDKKAEPATKTVTREVVKTVTDVVLSAEIDEKNTDDLTFVNTYDVEPVKLNFPVKKVLAKPDDTEGPNIKEAYTFTLTAPTGTPMPDSNVVKNPDNDGGTATYGDITYTKPGVYTYTVTETGEVEGVTNQDPATGTIVVTVIDNKDGTMSASATSTAEKPLTFTNSYKYEVATLTPQVHKTLETPEGVAGPKIEGEYTFTLSADKDVPMPQTDTVVTNPANGTADFGTITYSTTGTYTYTVTESGSVIGVVNDAQPAKTFTVKVTDDKQGHLVAKADYGENQGHVTFKNKYEVVNVPVEKTWDDDNNRDGKRPSSITVNLGGLTSAQVAEFAKAGITVPTTASVTPDKDGNWAYEFTNLPKYAANGAEIEYVVTEQPVTDYTTEISGSIADGFTIVNTHEPETVTVEGEKKWNDADYLNYEGYQRPSSITINLIAKVDGKEITLDGVTTTTKAEPEAWTFSFTNLPKYQPGEVGKEIEYSVEESPVPGFTPVVNTGDESLSYEVVNTPERDDEDELTPTEINLKKVDKLTGEIIPTGAEFTLSSDVLAKDETYKTGEDGTITIPFTKDGTYTLTETKTPEGYKAEPVKSYTITVEKNFIEKVKLNEKKSVWTWIYELIAGNDSADFKNGILTVENTPEETKVEGTKEWDDATNQDGKRPDSVTFQLYKTVNNVESKVEGKTLVLSKPTGATVNEWKGEIDKLPLYENGYKVTYSFKELNAEGQPVVNNGKLDENYTAEYKTGTYIINSYTPEVTTVKVTKQWDDADDQDGKRPESVDVTLKADGNDITQEGIIATVTLDEDNTWTHTWTGLNKKAAGKDIVYTVVEDEVPAEYTVTYTGSQTTGLVVKNSHAPELLDIDGEKTWNDSEYIGKNGYARPESIKVTLYAEIKNEDGSYKTVATYEKTVTPGEDKTWKYGWTDLPKYNSGQVIRYTVKEDVPDEYTYETVENTNLVNTPKEKVDVINPVKLKIQKTDKVTGDALENATFEVKDSKGQVVTSVKTNAKGEAEIEFTAEDTYKMTETAPTGYTSDPGEWTIEVKQSGVDEVKYNNPNEGVWNWIYHLFFGEETDYEAGVLKVSNPPIPTDVTPKKVWNDNSDKDKVRPDSVTFGLYKTVGEDGTPVAVVGEDGKNVTVTLTKPEGETVNTWTGAKINNLPSYENGKPVTYSFKELNGTKELANGDKLPGKKNAEGEDTEYTVSYGDDNVTVTNSYQSKPVKEVSVGSSTTNIDGNEVQPGDTLTYKITYKNTTGGKLDNVTITDSIPAHTTLVDGSVDMNGSAADGVITWNFANVEDGREIVVSFKVTVDDDVDGEVLKNKSKVNDGKNDYNTNETSNPTPSDPVKDVFDAEDDTTSIDGDVVEAGQHLLYKITYKNTTGKDADVEITDKLPDNTTFVSADNDGKNVNGTVTWKLKVANGKEVTVSFIVEVVANDGTSVDNTATAKVGKNSYNTNETTNPTGTDPVKDVFDAGDTTTSIDGKPVKPGQELTYTITYTNTTGKDVTAEITDTIPTYTTYKEGSATNGGKYEGGKVSWSIDVAKDAKPVTVSFTVTVNEDVSGEAVVNDAKVKVGKNNYDTNEVTNPTPPAKTVYSGTSSTEIDGKPVKPGDVLRYEIKYTNPTKEAVDATITDKIPAHTTYVDGSISEPGKVSGDNLTWNIKVGPSASVTVSFQVKVDADVSGETLTNESTVKYGDNEYTSNETSNPTPPKKDVYTGTSTTTINGQEVKPGDELTYSITFKNSKAEAVNATITDVIPAYTTYVPNSADNAGTYDAASKKITWTKEVAAKSELKVTFKVKVDADAFGQTLTNEAVFKEGKDGPEITTNPVENPVINEIVITKDLKNFVQHEGEDVKAVFAFRITGTSEKRGNYSNVVSMEFTGADTKEVTVTGLPSDIKNLKVEEIVSGNYTASDNGVKQDADDGKYKVTFTNKYKNTDYKTGTINNYKRGEDGKYHANGTGDNKSQKPTQTTEPAAEETQPDESGN